jgi:hypothetical protein
MRRDTTLLAVGLAALLVLLLGLVTYLATAGSGVPVGR